MRAKEYLRTHQKSMYYFEDVKQVINDLYNIRHDKEATVDYYDRILISDIRYDQYTVDYEKYDNLGREFGYCGLPEVEYTHYTDEIDIDYALCVREELLKVVQDDKSFEYIFHLLNKQSTDVTQHEIDVAIREELNDELISANKQILELEQRLKEPISKSKSENTSNIQLTNKKGIQIDFIRVINCLFELGFFKNVNGRDTVKKEVFDTFGKALNKDLSTFNQQLTTTKNASNRDLISVKKIFHTMLDKQNELNT
jgi:hypothetical protein